MKLTTRHKELVIGTNNKTQRTSRTNHLFHDLHQYPQDLEAGSQSQPSYPLGVSDSGPPFPALHHTISMACV